LRILKYCTSSVLDARSAPVKAFIRATWLLDSWDLLPKVMDVTLEFADFPFLTGKALALLKEYLVHIHVGNCVKVTGNPAYGDKHPRFGVDGGVHDVDDLARFLKILFDIGYLGKKTGGNGKPPVVGFEVKPLPGESSGVVLASTKRVWRQAWAQLQMGAKTSRH